MARTAGLGSGPTKAGRRKAAIDEAESKRSRPQSLTPGSEVNREFEQSVSLRNQPLVRRLLAPKASPGHGEANGYELV